MKIKINNQIVDVQSKTLGELATEQKLPAKGVAVAVNNKMVPRSEWNDFVLADEQQITILKAFCGG